LVDPLPLLALAGLLLSVLSAVPFVRRRPLSTFSAPESDTLAFLAYRLRRAGHRVDFSPGQVKVQLGRSSAVVFTAQASGGSSRIQWRPSATSSGWGSVILLFLIFYPLAFLGPVLLWLAARRFVDGDLRAILPPGPAIPPAPGPNDLEFVVLTGLSEARRVALEALDATKTRRGESVAKWSLLGLLVGFVFLLAVGAGAILASSVPPEERVPLGLLSGAATAISIGAIGGWLALRRWRRPISDLRGWESRLAGALSAITQGESAAEPATSAFETLAAAAREVPLWASASRRAAEAQDPVAGWLPVVLWLVVLVPTLLMLSALSLYFLIVGHALALPFIIGAIAVTAGAVVGFRYYQRKRLAALKLASERQLREWAARFDETRIRMESYLRGL